MAAAPGSLTTQKTFKVKKKTGDTSALAPHLCQDRVRDFHRAQEHRVEPTGIPYYPGSLYVRSSTDTRFPAPRNGYCRKTARGHLVNRVTFDAFLLVHCPSPFPPHHQPYGSMESPAVLTIILDEPSPAIASTSRNRVCILIFWVRHRNL